MGVGRRPLARLEMRRPDPAFWAGKRVLLTGHTGFKGSWAALWLHRLGAQVTGLALAPDQTPALFDLAGVERRLESLIVDLRDQAAVEAALADRSFDLVLHMAAADRAGLDRGSGRHLRREHHGHGPSASGLAGSRRARRGPGDHVRQGLRER